MELIIESASLDIKVEYFAEDYLISTMDILGYSYEKSNATANYFDYSNYTETFDYTYNDRQLIF